MTLIKDSEFKVKVINQTAFPQLTCYADMHCCYSEDYVWDEFFDDPYYIWKDPFNDCDLTEEEAGKRLIKNCIKYKHWGVLENPSITLAVAGFPHTVMQQLRTHRVAVHFGVQSGRYTGQRICDVVDDKRSIQEVFYVRPVGEYTDRGGELYKWTEEDVNRSYQDHLLFAKKYKQLIDSGVSHEHAREIYTPYGIRQNFVVTFNCRSLMHMLDMRTPKDAQLEIRQLCEQIIPHFLEWMPEVAQFYVDKRLGRNQLAP